MNIVLIVRLVCSLAAIILIAGAALAQNPDNAAPGNRDRGPRPGEASEPGTVPFEGPPPFGPGGMGRGPMGGVRQDIKLVKQFDRDGDKRLNAAERKAAREHLSQQRTEGGGPRGPGFRGRGAGGGPAAAGPKLAPADVKSFPGKPLYDEGVLRTLFLEFENADWEKELSDFHGTDVDVPAKLTVDGKVYADVGVHFRGASSYMMVPETRKRSLNLSLDFANENQALEGYRTLNLLNSHEDPSFIRTALYLHIARECIPAPKANFVRVVINGESWGVYTSAQQFNKDFTRDWFESTKGARWKTPGSPNGRASLAYLGEDPAPYKRLYDIKSKDDAKSWGDLIRMCKVLNETPANELEQALSPILNMDGALKFLALENVLINNDGYWVRSSDYNIYEDEKGRFHIIPHDANETFVAPGGPGGFGGGPGGPGGFGPGLILARQAVEQGDADKNGKLTRAEFLTLAENWYGRLDPERTGKLSQEQFADRFGELLPVPGGRRPPGDDGPPGGRGLGGRGGFGPGRFLGPSFFTATDANKDGVVTRTEFQETFAAWEGKWDTDKTGALDEEKLRAGFEGALPRPGMMSGPGGEDRRGGGGRGPGGPGFGGGPRVNGVELDPLVSASDSSRPLASKLLAVPALRARYLGYVRDLAERWLDWNRLGPVAKQYHELIAADVEVDTHKLDTTEAFQRSLTESIQGGGGFGNRGTIGLKMFADQRRAYLLNHPEVKKATVPASTAPAR